MLVWDRLSPDLGDDMDLTTKSGRGTGESSKKILPKGHLVQVLAKTMYIYSKLCEVWGDEGGGGERPFAQILLC